MKKDLNKLTVEELKKELEQLEKQKEKVTTKEKEGWKIGKNYVIRTVTMIQVGKLIGVGEQELFLEDAAWVADTGRWKDFLQDGTVKEVEPFPEGIVTVGRAALIDATIWKHELLRSQK